MLIEIIIALVIIGYLFKKYSVQDHDRFKRAGIEYNKPYPYLGSTPTMVLRNEAPLDMLLRLYNEFPNKRFSGMFFFRQPVLMIKDPELIRKVMVKDFDHFVNRNQFVDEEAEPLLGKSLINIKDQNWRDSRNILSPTFTTSKMKNTFHLIDVIGSQLQDYLSDKLQQQNDGVLKVEFKDLFTRFTNDVIATSAFGVKVDSLRQPNNDFYLMGRQATSFGYFTVVVQIMHFLVPSLMKKWKLSMLGPKATTFFTNLIVGAVKERDENKIIRPDLLHLLMQARAVQNEKGETVKPGLSEEDIICQSVLFFFAGFETVSTFLSFAAYELAVNPDIQVRLQEEIDKVMEEDNGQVTYEGLMTKMKYLDQVANEVMRKWPPAPFLDRSVSKTYKIEAEDGDPEITLNVKDVVWIPAGALHHDPNYFPNPNVFDPERFSEENKHKIKPFTFMPFGMGPRNCVGMRFALMESKLCLVKILRNYDLVKTSKTQIPLKLTKKFQMGAENGYHLGIRKRTTV